MKMGRLIDESLLQEKLALIPMEERTFRRTVEELENAPTVEAIPKAIVKKVLEEGTKNVSNNVLAIVREDYMHKANYENRLKTDMVAMLEELKEQLREMHEDFFETEHFDEAYGVSDSMDIIQQKINELKGSEDGNK